MFLEQMLLGQEVFEQMIYQGLITITTFRTKVVRENAFRTNGVRTNDAAFFHFGSSFAEVHEISVTIFPLSFSTFRPWDRATKLSTGVICKWVY